MIRLKRIYEKSSPTDGYRVLVDRLWPRGMSKAAAALDGWLKEVAPSNELRKWFNHEPEKYPQFKQLYQEELQFDPQKAAFDKLVDLVHQESVVTLLYGAKNEELNQAVVLKELLEQTNDSTVE